MEIIPTNFFMIPSLKNLGVLYLIYAVGNLWQLELNNSFFKYSI